MTQPVRRFRFLLDLWVEPREVESLPAVVRGRIRDLDSDEEKYVGSFAEAEQVVEARLDDGDLGPHRWERP